MIKNLFNNFLRNALIGLFIFSILSSILVTLALNFAVYNKPAFNLKFIINVIISLLFIASIRIIYIKRHNIALYAEKLLNIKNLIIFILIGSFIIKTLWITLTSTIPVSDFGLMYNAAKDVCNGNFSNFHNFEYFARFPHDSITVLYFSLFYKLNENPLFIVKLFNVLLSTISVYIMYRIVKELFGYKSALVSALLFSLFPPFIMYNSQMLSENMAIPFYLASMYFFIKYIKDTNKYLWIILSGLTLAGGNLFRMVGIIFLIAYVMYMAIYKGFKSSIKSIPMLIFMFIMPVYLTSTILLNSGITETNLWQPKETSLTSVLKGTNMTSFGFWNKEDAEIPIKYNYDNKKVKEECIRLIKDRLLNSPPYKVIGLYIGKLGGELGFSDLNSYEFTVLDSNDTIGTNLIRYFSFTLLILINAYYIFLLYSSLMYLKKNKTAAVEMNLFLIISFGFICFYLISEVQPRYSFIYCWTFVILATAGLKMQFSHKSDSTITEDSRLNLSD